MKVILASKNAHKLEELSAILGQLGFEIALESEYGLDIEVEETGTTFEENSLLKAEAVMKASGLPVLADDSGLMVDALHGAPGVYSARYGHKNSDAERVEYLLEERAGRGPHGDVCLRDHVPLAGWTEDRRAGRVSGQDFARGAWQQRLWL